MEPDSKASVLICIIFLFPKTYFNNILTHTAFKSRLPPKNTTFLLSLRICVSVSILFIVIISPDKTYMCVSDLSWQMGSAPQNIRLSLFQNLCKHLMIQILYTFHTVMNFIR